MKQRSTGSILLCLALLFVLLSTGCGQRSEGEASSSTAMQVAAEPIHMVQALGLSENQSYLVCDDRENQLLLLTYDTEKENPAEAGRDQANTTYYEAFLQYDLTQQAVVGTYPIEAFLIIPSACFYGEGFVYSAMEETTSGAWDTTLYYQKAQEGEKPQAIPFDFSGLTPFGSGPILSRCGEAVIFGYGGYGDRFDLQVLQPDLTVSSLLSFPWETLEDIEWITDDFCTSDTHYLYPVGQNGQVVLYLGEIGKDPIQIPLPKGEKLYAFALGSDQILLSRTLEDSFCLQRLDLTGQSLEIYETQEPCQALCINQLSQFCVSGENLTLGIYAIVDDTIQPVPVDTTFLASTWNDIYANGADFIMVSHLPVDDPYLWRISLQKASPSPGV